MMPPTASVTHGYRRSMPRHPVGPRRSVPARSTLTGTRILAVVAAVALTAALLSDSFGDFWVRHALSASLVASLLVIMLSAGIFNEAVERRRRRRWSVVAQHVMFELARNARMYWTGVLEMAGVLTPEAVTSSNDPDGASVVDPAALTAALTELMDDRPRRQRLQEILAALVPANDVLLGRWAGVMLNADIYAEVIDRHVESAENFAWVSSLLDLADPPADTKRNRRAMAGPTARIQGVVDDEVIVRLMVRSTQLAEELDRQTFSLALRIVPVEWWLARLRTEPVRPLPA